MDECKQPLEKQCDPMSMKEKKEEILKGTPCP